MISVELRDDNVEDFVGCRQKGHVVILKVQGLKDFKNLGPMKDAKGEVDHFGVLGGKNRGEGVGASSDFKDDQVLRMEDHVLYLPS